MATAVVSASAQVGGYSFVGGVSATGDGQVTRDPTLAAAKTGTLSTRTSNTAGTLTMTTGHGFTNGQVIDIYWATGQCTRATIGTVATNSVPFTGAGGDVLPIATTAITAMVVHAESVAILDAELTALAVGIVGSVAPCSVTFLDDSDAVIGRALVRVGTATTPKHFIWESTSGVAIPISDDVASISMSHGDSDNSRTVVMAALLA